MREDVFGEAKGIERHIELSEITAPDAEGEQKPATFAFHAGDGGEAHPEALEERLDFDNSFIGALMGEEPPGECDAGHAGQPEPGRG